VLSKTQILTVVGLGLILGTVITGALRQRNPDRVPLIPMQRFRAWWLMVVGLILAHIFASYTEHGPIPQVVSFAILSTLAMREFFKHLDNPPTGHTKLACYLSVIAQYYWVYINWYGFFLVFIPVFIFLYLPVSDRFQRNSRGALLEMASIHWILMTCVFCLSHAAFLLDYPGGQGLLLFVVLLTEVADVVRMLLSRNEVGRKLSPLLSSASAIGVALLVGPAFTPLTLHHTLLAGLVIGVAGSIGHLNVASISESLNIKPGGPLARIESLAYTAPIFLHGYRYFDYPID